MRYGFVVLFVIVGMWVVAASVRPFPETYAVPPAPVPEAMSACGTLTYERNDMGEEIPYLVFRFQDGSLGVKSLTFAPVSVCVATSGSYPCVIIADAVPSYFGSGPVSVAGILDVEHIIVSRMQFASSGQCGLR